MGILLLPFINIFLVMWNQSYIKYVDSYYRVYDFNGRYQFLRGYKRTLRDAIGFSLRWL
jgi:hypothetical protein